MPDFGDNSPRENYGALDPNAPSVANGQITPDQWAEYEKKRKRDAILGILSVLGGTTALGGLGQYLNQPGSGAVPDATTGAPDAGVGGNLPSTGFPMSPYPGTAAMNPPGGLPSALAGLGPDVVNQLKGSMRPQDWAALVAALAGTVGGVVAGNNANPNAPNTSATDPALKNLIDLQTGRLAQQQPLYEAILKMAMGLMPTQYQGAGVPAFKLPGGTADMGTPTLPPPQGSLQDPLQKVTQ